MNVKLRGVYDIELFRYLKKVGINHFGFDLRPASFNFTPLKSISEMLADSGDSDDFCFFMFGSEKDFVIDQLMTMLRNRTALSRERCFLEFTDAVDLAACSKFETPFVWRFNDRVEYRKIASNEFLKGISFSYSYLESLRDSNQLYPFIMELMALKRDDQWIDLRLDWSDHMSESVIDFFQPRLFGFEINQKVETGYRHINMNLVGSHLEHAKRILNLET